MATPENTFISSVHRHLPVGLYHMKNHNQYNGGIADVWYSGAKADLWIEYKFISTPKRDATVVVPGLSELQKDWLRSRHLEGRSVGVIIGSKEGGWWLPGTSWETPQTIGQLRPHLMNRAALAGMISRLTFN